VGSKKHEYTVVLCLIIIKNAICFFVNEIYLMLMAFAKY